MCIILFTVCEGPDTHIFKSPGSRRRVKSKVSLSRLHHFERLTKEDDYTIISQFEFSLLKKQGVQTGRYLKSPGSRRRVKSKVSERLFNIRDFFVT